jgi:predicted Rossmann fold flavoprotein
MRIIVIGGGAGGFFGAINRALVAPQDEVILLEAAQPLAKVRISGGGRCNVTHHCFEPAQLVQNYPRGGRALRGAFTRFAPQDTVAWFRHQGVILKTEADGRMFPVSDSSQTIVDCLLSTAKRLGVKILVGMAVKQVEQGFRIILKNGQVWESDRLLLATGSNPSGYRFAQALGHTIIPPVPSLFTFTISDPRLQGLAGVAFDKVRLQLTLTKLEQTGPLLITHWGLSGPAVLKLSAWGARILAASHYQHPLTINWVPEHNAHSLRELFLQTKQDSPKKKILGYAPVSLPRRFWQQILTYLGIKPETLWADFSKSHLQQLTEELTQGRYQVQGKGVFKEEFVTCGGVDLKEVNFKTMESKLCLGLFFAGEVLDIDGVTGGFNFQSAWTTAWLAAQSMG